MDNEDASRQEITTDYRRQLTLQDVMLPQVDVTVRTWYIYHVQAHQVQFNEA